MAEAEFAIGAEVSCSDGFCGKVSSYFREELGLVEVECLSQFELQAAIVETGQAELEELGRLTIEVGALYCGNKLEASLRGGCFNRSDEIGFRCHEWDLQ